MSGCEGAIECAKCGDKYNCVDALRARVAELEAANATRLEDAGLASIRERVLTAEVEVAKARVAELDRHWLVKFAAETARAADAETRAIAAEQRVERLEAALRDVLPCAVGVAEVGGFADLNAAVDRARAALAAGESQADAGGEVSHG